MRRSGKHGAKVVTARSHASSAILRSFASAVSVPFNFLPEKSHDPYAYSRNCEEYRKTLEWKARLLQQMSFYQNPSDVPQVMEMEFDRVNVWIRFLEAWFYSTGNPLPVVELDKMKRQWNSKLYEAGQEIKNRYEEDRKLPPAMRRYKDLTDASNAFWDEHEFVKNPGTTPESLYENVKKVK